MTRVAGNGTRGYSGDNGPATSAQLNCSGCGIALDSSGNIYIADGGNNVVRKVSNGVITTVAGDGNNGFSGDGGPATAARLYQPMAVAVNAAGNLYIADSANSAIRMVSNGVISIVVAGGLPRNGFSGDNGPATSAQLNFPQGIAVDSAGDLYIADYFNYRIRKVSNGVITTVAGNGTAGLSGDNGPATSAQIYGAGVALDSAGNLYITGSDVIREVSHGVITSVAGNGTSGFGGDNGPATSAQLNVAGSAAVDAAGNIYIADGGNNRIRKVSKGVITTIAGGGTGGDHGAATSAQIVPFGVAVDSAGNVYIADYLDDVVRKVSNGVITTVAGNGVSGFSGDGGPATSAQLDNPLSIAVDSAGNLYITDNRNYRVRMVSNGVITTVAGNGTQGSSGDNGPATSAQIGPAAIAVDAAGNLYIADYISFTIRKVANGIITTVTGFDAPTLVAVDSAGDLYFTNGEMVRKLANGIITTVAGNGEPGFSGDNGPATSAQLDCGQCGVAVDSSGNLYIAGPLNNLVRKVSNGIITTIAGNGTAGFSGDGGPATSAQLNWPVGIAVDASGKVYVADEFNGRIRVLNPAEFPSTACRSRPGGCRGSSVR